MVHHKGGDILALFGTQAKVEVEIAPAEETLAAGHAERISSALAHVGRGVSVLQELINLAARRPNPQTTPIGIAHDAPSAGPIADAASASPITLPISGKVAIDIDDALKALNEEYLGLEQLKSAILDLASDSFVSRKELPALAARVREAQTTANSERGLMLRSEVQEVIVAPMMEFAKKLIGQRLMVTKSGNGHKGGDLRV